MIYICVCVFEKEIMINIMIYLMIRIYSDIFTYNDIYNGLKMKYTMI